MFPRCLIFALTVVFAAANGYEASAGSFHITPIQITLNSDGDIQTVKVKNLADRETTVQLRVTPEGDGSDNLTDKILAVPPVFSLPPSGEQTVRLAARGMELISSEQAYTLWLKEVPAPLAKEGAALAVALNMKLPLYVAPANGAPKLRWQITENNAGGLDLVLINAGNIKTKVNGFWLEAQPEKRPLFVERSSKLMRAGDRQVWALDLDLAALREPPVVRAETDVGPIEAVLSLPGG